MRWTLVFASSLLATQACRAQTGSAPLPAAPAVTRADSDGVRRAVLDYLEGFYEGDTAKIARSLRPEVSKYGFWRAKGSSSYEGERMTYVEAVAYAARFKAQKRTTPATAPREVTLFEVQDQTASAKVRAWWGTDYLLLAKYDGQWKILHVIWQGP